MLEYSYGVKMFNEEKSIKRFLDNLNLENLSDMDKLIKVTEAVAAIPWGEARSIEEVFRKGIGTCTGKHKVLGACYKQLGIKYHDVVVTFRWQDQKIKYPEEIQSILDEGPWLHGHNFIQLENGLNIDIIFNSELREYGFKTFPQDWDGQRSFIGFDNLLDRWDDNDSDKIKKDLIENLKPDEKERRKRFLYMFIKWVSTLNISAKPLIKN